MNTAAGFLSLRYAEVTGSEARRRQSLTWVAYAVLLTLGGALWFSPVAPGWRAFGIGLWGPGLGLLASGGWTVLLLPLVLLLFAACVFFWFAAGATTFPVIVWLGSAVLAGLITGPQPWQGAPLVAAGIVGLVISGQTLRVRKRTSIQRALAAKKTAGMAQLVSAAQARAVRAPLGDRELDPEMLAASRYLLDRGLQPVSEFNGFDEVDIFQTASVRYQINFIGYALAILNAHYLPSFRGYLDRAQRQLIEKYLLPKVWRYWVYESMWGHLNFTNWDPAAKDNIMLTGYFGSQVNLYMKVTGSRRYAEPGSLTFRLNNRTAFEHDAHSINRSLVENFSRSAYCLYPCEPNWIYPACNFRGMLSLVAYDQVFQTAFADGLNHQFWRSVDNDFTDAAGSIIALRSSITGIPFPFPGSDMSFAPMANVFEPERAMRLWAPIAMGLRQAIIEKDGELLLGLPNKGIDFGNYRRGARTMAACSIMQIAREFGDEELAVAARGTLRAHGGERHDGGVLSFANGSNMSNIYGMQGIFARMDDIRSAWLDGPDPASLRGPLLDNDNYTDILVAAAHSDGEDLRLVLYPGGAGGARTLHLSRLMPGRRYRAEGQDEVVIADHDGEASLAVIVDGRTHVHIRPAE